MTKKLTIKDIKLAIELENEYELLSKEYINNHSKLEILHKSCGDLFWMNWVHFNRGQRCPKCNGKYKHTLKFVKEQIKLFDGYELLSKQYINSYLKLEIIHSLCGESFWMSWNTFNAGQRCKKCYLESVTGENHHNWNPNLTDDDRENGRNCPENREWRKAVYERDDHTCQKCLVRGGSLQAHHILPWALFPELRFEVENGITLCKFCHNRYHSVWGKGEGCNHKTMKTHLIYNHDL